MHICVYDLVLVLFIFPFVDASILTGHMRVVGDEGRDEESFVPLTDGLQVATKLQGFRMPAEGPQMMARWALAPSGKGKPPLATTARSRHVAPLATAGALSLPADANVVVLGPGSLDLRLLAAKLAARSGFRTSLFGPTGGARDIWLEQMYGVEDPSTAVEDSSEPRRASVVSSGPEREMALTSADAIVLISEGGAMSEAALTSVLQPAVKLKRIVLLSSMGVTRATAGPLGLGREAVDQREAEQRLAAACASRSIGLSIVRVGTLKGGGPGGTENSVDAGLARPYYKNPMDIETLRVTQAYDKLTLGAKITAGDPFEQANTIQKQLRKGSFDPQDNETSRVVACAAVVAALRHKVPLEFSVSAAEGKAAPSAGQWEALLNRL